MTIAGTRPAPEVPSTVLGNRNVEVREKHLQSVFNRASLAGLQGFAVGAAVSSALGLFAHRFSPAYRRITLPGKIMMFSIASFGLGMFAAEHEVYLFSHSEKNALKTGGGPVEQSAYRSIADVVADNRIPIIFGVFTATSAVAVWRLRKQGGFQPALLVQNARLYAQFAGVLSVLAVIAITSSHRHQHRDANDEHEFVKVVK